MLWCANQLQNAIGHLVSTNSGTPPLSSFYALHLFVPFLAHRWKCGVCGIHVLTIVFTLDLESRNGHSPSTSAAPSYRHHTGYHHLTSECLVSLLFEAIRWWCHPEVHIQLSSSHLIVTKPIFVFCWSLSHMVHTFPWKIGGRRRETSVLLAPLFWHFVFWLNLDRPDVIQHMNVMELLPRYREPF